jgi:hypothetical protein
VAELTGRKLRVVRRANSFIVEKRSDGEARSKEVNMREKDSFMKGIKMVAVIRLKKKVKKRIHLLSICVYAARLSLPLELHFLFH